MSDSNERLKQSPCPIAGESNDPSGLVNPMGAKFEAIKDKRLTSPDDTKPEGRPGASR